MEPSLRNPLIPIVMLVRFELLFLNHIHGHCVILRIIKQLIDSLGWHTDGGGAYTNEPSIVCQSTAATCTACRYAPINQRTYFGFTRSAWALVIKTSVGSVANNWRMITRIDLTQTYPLISSPVNGSLPMIRVREGLSSVIQIPAAGLDTTNDIRCRWASIIGAAGDECSDLGCDSIYISYIFLEIPICPIFYRKK
ncbi:unnamed protein product [Rotaria magnacalcarata]|uniref:Uncharacterized protein n=1 Tax=Rotaria magnacalcarata TaxID=392030 RepID=A0A816Q8D3_9BILA|nr:unnamed protein product [Rotaria magnacalcarata]